MIKLYMAIDQYGQTYHGLTHPRKDLLEKKDGSIVHTGYVIGGLWLSLYEVKPFERKQ